MRRSYELVQIINSGSDRKRRNLPNVSGSLLCSFPRERFGENDSVANRPRRVPCAVAPGLPGATSIIAHRRGFVKCPVYSSSTISNIMWIPPG